MPDLDPITPHRQRVGGDVYLTPSPPGAAGEWRVDVGFAVPDWKASATGSQTRAAFPGTAILVGGRWFEICRIGPLDGAPHRTAYDLWPWNDANVIRIAFELTPEACETLTRNRRAQQRRQRRGTALALLPVLTGLLPAEVQRRLETETGQPAVRSTLISAMLLLLLSTLVIGLAFALGAGTHFGEFQSLIKSIVAFAPLAAYLLVESGMRMYSANGNEPLGTLPVCLPYYLFRGFAGMNVSQEKLDQKRAAKAPASGLLAARDRIQPLDHPEYDLEVVSRLPKDHWTANTTGIEYQGEAYILVERKMLRTKDGPRHHFLLKKPEHEVLFSSYLHYQPEEVRDVYRAQERAKTATWVETVPFLWGLIPGPTQERLSRIYNYDPDKWTLRTIAGGAVAGIILAVASAASMAGGLAGTGEAVRFFVGVIVAWEAGVRWLKLRRGELPGSLLGIPWKPVAEWCLRWE